MNYKKHIILLFMLLPLFTACVSGPGLEKAQFSQLHYTFTVLLIPEEMQESPRLELAMSLLNVNLPEEQANFLNRLLYSTDNLDEYRDRVIREQRERARLHQNTSAPGEERLPNFHWRYVERINVHNPQKDGVVIERCIETFIGGAHSLEIKRYFVADLDRLRQIRIDDLFSDFQGDAVREIVYEELRKYSSLDEEETLSQGIYFKDEPELSFNFYVTEAGLGLRWDPYEIAPFSEGGIEVILPWRSIRPLMLPGGLDLLTKFGIYLR